MLDTGFPRSDAENDFLRARRRHVLAALARATALSHALLALATGRADHLEAQITGQPAFRIFANVRDKFFYKIVDARLDFEREVDGKVVAVVLRQNGGHVRAPRIVPH